MSARKRTEKRIQYRFRFCPDNSDTGFDLQHGTLAECNAALRSYVARDGRQASVTENDDGTLSVRMGEHYGSSGAGSGSVQPMPVRVHR